MNLLNRVMSYDKTKVNQENCNCEECIGITNTFEKKEIIGNFRYVDDFLRKIENYRMMYREKELLAIINLKYWYKDKKTKIFIWKALHVHGDKYDYSNVIYVKSDINVEIICKVKGHKPFPQKPRSHLKGHGCKLCGFEKLANERKITFEEFIERANKIHGEGRYNYSKVNYINYDTEVIIICPKHGDFKQTPNSHLHGHGCQTCAREYTGLCNKSNLEEFKKNGNIVHGEGTYNYSKVNYINNQTEVIIICQKHGPFPQTPANHLKGEGCPSCRESKGEMKIRIFLTNNNIQFEREKRFEDCRHKKPLPFDFYLPQYNLCIEFDGQLHYMSVKYFGGDEKLNERKDNDLIKSNYCKEKGINLLRIRYDENVEEKLTEYFQEHEIIQESTIF